MTKEKKIFQPLTSESICEIYNLLHSEGLVAFPITPESINKIESLIVNINGKSFSLEHYPAVKKKIVAYLYFLIKNHPFTDGNKRTAILTFLVLCRMNNLQTNLFNFELDALAVFLEQYKHPDYQKSIKP